MMKIGVERGLNAMARKNENTYASNPQSPNKTASFEPATLKTGLANNKADNYILSFGIALPVGSALLFLMAWSGINADEKLIKSIDRLRD